MRTTLLVVATVIATVPALAGLRTLKHEAPHCTLSLHYDPAKDDPARLEATLAFLEDEASPIEITPTSGPPTDRPDLAGLRTACAAHRAKLEEPRFIDLPGMEALRQREIANLEDSCRVAEIETRAGMGDVAALRSYAPAAAHCSRFVDALELHGAELEAFASDIASKICGTHKRAACLVERAKEYRKDGEGSERKLILNNGWGNCAAEYMLVNQGTGPSGQPQKPSVTENMRAALLKRFSQAFNVKTLSCQLDD